jgi:predicted porin
VSKLDPPPDWSGTYTVRQPVSTKTDSLFLTGRYKPVKGLTFRAKYAFQKIDRTNAGAWNLTDSTTKNTITLDADSRLHSKVLFNLKYAYKNISDPAYNTDPDHSHTGRIGLTWLLHPKFNMLFSYDLNHQERDNLNFSSTDDPWYRETDTDNFLVMGTYQMSQKFTLSASYSYLQYEVVQDLAYQDLGGTEQVDRNVPMDQKAHVVTLGAHYRLSDVLYFLADVSSTRSEGGFSPSSADLLEPVSIASFSKMEQRYFFLHLGSEYKLSNGMSLDLDYRFADLDDVLNNVYDDIDDGKAHIAILSATKKW